jgi:hypothetical protein
MHINDEEDVDLSRERLWNGKNITNSYCKPWWLCVGIYDPSLRSKSFYKFLDDIIFICLVLFSIL